jgi:hypothetical protein
MSKEASKLGRSPMLIKAEVESDWRAAGGKSGFTDTFKQQVLEQFGIQVKETRTTKERFPAFLTGAADDKQASSIKAAISGRVAAGRAEYSDLWAWEDARDALLSILRPQPPGSEVTVCRMKKEDQGLTPIGTKTDNVGLVVIKWYNEILVHQKAAGWKVEHAGGPAPLSKGERAVSLPLSIIHELAHAAGDTHDQAIDWQNQVRRALGLAEIVKKTSHNSLSYGKGAETTWYVWKSP